MMAHSNLCDNMKYGISSNGEGGVKLYYRDILEIFMSCLNVSDVFELSMRSRKHGSSHTLSASIWCRYTTIKGNA